MKTVEQIPYQIKYKKMNSVTLYLRDGYVEVHAPIHTDIKFIESLILKNKHKIETRLKNKMKYIEFKENGYLYLWGKKYIIHFIDKSELYYKIEEDIVYFYTYNPSILTMFYMTEIDKVTTKLVKFYADKMGLPMPKIQYKDYQSRYGTCFYKKGLVIFNRKLAYLEKAYLESVVVHELSHFYYPNHSKQFYNHINRYMPHYKLVHDELRKKDL